MKITVSLEKEQEQEVTISLWQQYHLANKTHIFKLEKEQEQEVVISIWQHYHLANKTHIFNPWYQFSMREFIRFHVKSHTTQKLEIESKLDHRIYFRLNIHIPSNVWRLNQYIHIQHEANIYHFLIYKILIENPPKMGGKISFNDRIKDDMIHWNKRGSSCTKCQVVSMLLLDYHYFLNWIF